jgi:hypothetical protein
LPKFAVGVVLVPTAIGVVAATTLAMVGNGTTATVNRDTADRPEIRQHQISASVLTRANAISPLNCYGATN